MPHVLVLTAPYGSGHVRAARAVAAGLTAEGASVDIVDHFVRFVSPSFARGSEALFWAVLRRVPRLWGLAYALAARVAPPSPLMWGVDRLGAGALGRHLGAARPAAVVHVHPTPAGALAWLRRRGQTVVPHAIVVTEFVAHPQWVFPGLDRYFVAGEEARDGVLARGIPAEQVVVTGVPVAPEFAVPVDRAVLQDRLGLTPGAPTVLVTAGMRGTLGGIADVCRSLAGLAIPFSALVVTGHDARLAADLAARVGDDRRFRIFGPVADMASLMGAADLVVTKAGASTCAEALALGRPLVFYRSLPGQERANEAALVRAGVGVRAGDRASLAACLAAVLAEDGPRDRLAAAARRARRAEAARVVAKEMLALLSG